MCSFLEDGGARAPNHEKRDARLSYIIMLASPRAHYSPEGARGDSFLVDVIRQGGWQNTLKRIIFVLADKGGK